MDAHPQIVTAVLVALVVHLRAAVPTPAAGSALSLVFQVWDMLVGNYGAAANKPPEVK